MTTNSIIFKIEFMFIFCSFYPEGVSWMLEIFDDSKNLVNCGFYPHLMTFRCSVFQFSKK